MALQRQRDDVLGFARVIDDKLAVIAQRRRTPLYWVQQVCRMHRKKPTSTAYWQRWGELRARLGTGLVADVRAARFCCSSAYRLWWVDDGNPE